MDKTNRQAELENYIKDALTLLSLSNSRLRFAELEFIDESDEDYEGNDYYILKLDGGLNGRGQFLFYLEDVAELVKRLMCRFSDVWLIKWENDCPDDVFYLEIGLRF